MSHEHMLGSKLASTTYDPDKVWLSVEYPDSVRGSAKKLKQLLDALRSDTMDPCIGMNEIEWTLSARINCDDDDSISLDSPECRRLATVSASEKKEVDIKDAATLTESAQTTDDSEGVPELNILPTTRFFSLTAPVCRPTTDGQISPNDPHCVLVYTETILVQMRYKFRENTNRQPGSIADRIISLIKENFLDQSSTCKVYVFKHNVPLGDIRGISPSPSTNYFEPQCKRTIDEEMPPLFDPFDDVDKGGTAEKKVKTSDK